MKPLPVFLFLFVWSANIFAQNLVPNNSFELADCPSAAGQPEKATSWESCRTSPDFISRCATNSQVGVPKNQYGFQEPVDGNNYMHVGTYGRGSYREYIGCKLTESMVTGKKYYLSVWVCRTEGMNLYASCNNFGFRFSKVHYSEKYPCAVDNFSHYHWTAPITDTENWTHLSGSFIADSAYQYLILGNFYDDQHCEISDRSSYASIFVDFVCVTRDSVSCGQPGNKPLLVSLPVVFPNPTNDGRFYIDEVVRKQTISCRLLDNTGKEIPLQRDAKIPNCYLLPSRGNYSLELVFQDTKSVLEIKW